MNVNKLGIIPLIAVIILLLFSLSGCRGAVSLGEEFTLRIGQSVSIEGEDLKITFTEISGDSRCASDVVCVWAGEVTCVMGIKEGEKISSTEFVYPGLTDNYSQLTYQERLYTFKVEPYPVSGKEISDSKYRLFLTID